MNATDSLSLLNFLRDAGFTDADDYDNSYLTLPNGGMIKIGNVNAFEKTVSLLNPGLVRLWFAAVHQLPVSMIVALVKQAVEDNQ